MELVPALATWERAGSRSCGGVAGKGLSWRGEREGGPGAGASREAAAEAEGAAACPPARGAGAGAEVVRGLGAEALLAGAVAEHEMGSWVRQAPSTPKPRPRRPERWSCRGRGRGVRVWGSGSCHTRARGTWLAPGECARVACPARGPLSAPPCEQLAARVVLQRGAHAKARAGERAGAAGAAARGARREARAEEAASQGAEALQGDAEGSVAASLAAVVGRAGGSAAGIRGRSPTPRRAARGPRRPGRSPSPRSCDPDGLRPPCPGRPRGPVPST
mmetsp:Transcript_13178/g.39779  ORF Transcript_13178/g.39779 Transcript_13178/m.39779 type:complete len:276 (+) Transcript_13178:744-1571(+)